MFTKNINYKKIKPNTKFIGQNVFYYKTTDSTNNTAKNTSCNNGDLFIAETQTAGKGRMGRNWVSEKGAGIWMSLALTPKMCAEQIQQLTLVAGLSVCQTLCKLYSLPFNIKWPNDIVYDGKKICGILVEGTIEKNIIKKAIVGIGINVNNKKFCNELKEKASSVYIITKQKTDRVEIINCLAENFEKNYVQFLNEGIKPVLDEYKSLCITLNRDVMLKSNNESLNAHAYDITDNGELVIKKGDGTTLTVNSGEVSVRGYY